MKYRKKPVVIDAVEWKNNYICLQKLFHLGLTNEQCSFDKSPGMVVTKLVIKTLEGDMKVSNGDYVIKGVNGEFYPCKTDIFEKTYEAVIG